MAREWLESPTEGCLFERLLKDFSKEFFEKILEGDTQWRLNGTIAERLPTGGQQATFVLLRNFKS